MGTSAASKNYVIVSQHTMMVDVIEHIEKIAALLDTPDERQVSCWTAGGDTSKYPVRHGLTAETVIDALEGAEDYAAFEMAVTADYDASVAPRSWIACIKSLWPFSSSSRRSPSIIDQQLTIFLSKNDIAPLQSIVVVATYKRSKIE
jgi:hypothetical protein